MKKLSHISKGLLLFVVTMSITIGCSKDEPKQSDAELLMILGVSTSRPRIKFTNALSTSETYSVYTSACSSTPVISFGTVAPGGETAVVELPGIANSVIFSYNSPATSNCTQSGITLTNGTILFPNIYSCRSSTTAITCIRSGESDKSVLK